MATIRKDSGAHRADAITEAEARETARLARDLLLRLESAAGPSEPLLLQAARLARRAGSVQVEQWLDLELRGYNAVEPLSIEFLDHTRRWLDADEGQAMWDGLPAIEARLESLRESMRVLRVGETAGSSPKSLDAQARVIVRELQRITAQIARLSAIQASVRTLLHGFVDQMVEEFRPHLPADASVLPVTLQETSSSVPQSDLAVPDGADDDLTAPVNEKVAGLGAEPAIEVHSAEAAAQNVSAESPDEEPSIPFPLTPEEPLKSESIEEGYLEEITREVNEEAMTSADLDDYDEYLVWPGQASDGAYDTSDEEPAVEVQHEITAVATLEHDPLEGLDDATANLEESLLSDETDENLALDDDDLESITSALQELEAELTGMGRPTDGPNEATTDAGMNSNDTADTALDQLYDDGASIKRALTQDNEIPESQNDSTAQSLDSHDYLLEARLRVQEFVRRRLPGTLTCVLEAEGALVSDDPIEPFQLLRALRALTHDVAKALYPPRDAHWLRIESHYRALDVEMYGALSQPQARSMARDTFALLGDVLDLHGE